MSLELEVLADETWARSVADRIAAWIAAHHGSSLCLATGSTVAPVYQRLELPSPPLVFLLDEFGGLPADDPARCASMLRRDLPGVSFDRPDVDAADPHQAAMEYRARVDASGIDLAVVGLGINGHIGMNEPGSRRQDATRVVHLTSETAQSAAKYGASIRPSWGITVGLSELMAAGELWLVVSGEHKADVLARALQGGVGPGLPASFVQEHDQAVVLADASAARMLNG